MTPLAVPDDQINRIAQAVSEAMALHPHGKPWDRWIASGAAAIAMLSLIFSLGVNYAQITQNRADIAKIQLDIAQLQVAVGNQKTDTAVITTKLDALANAVAMMSGKLDRPR